MRKKNTELLADVIKRFLNEQRLQNRLDDKHIIDAWPVVLGKNISKYTQGLSIKNKVLYVSISSAVLRHDLFLSREEIKNALNKHVGAEAITDIIFR